MDDIITVAISIISILIGALIALIVERYRSKLKIVANIRDKQLVIYTELWQSLYNLKKSADELWKTANSDTLNIFAKNLQLAESMIGKNGLVIEKKDKDNLLDLIKIFWKFNYGKGKLIELRDDKIETLTDDILIQKTIRDNGEIKERYDKVMSDIEISLRKQLRTS